MYISRNSDATSTMCSSRLSKTLYVCVVCSLYSFDEQIMVDGGISKFWANQALNLRCGVDGLIFSPA